MKQQDPTVERRQEELLQLIKPDKAAQILDVASGTIYNWIWQGKIPSVKVLGCRRIRLRDLEKFIEENGEDDRKSKFILNKT